MSKVYKTIAKPYSDSLTGPVDQVIATLLEWKEQYGSDIRIEQELGYEEYGDGRRIELTIDRLETDEEESQREAERTKRYNEALERDRQNYLKLKAKFEPGD